MITHYEIRQICRIAHAIEHDKLRQSKKHGLIYTSQLKDLYDLFPDEFVTHPINLYESTKIRMDLIFLPIVIIVDSSNMRICEYIILHLLRKYCHVENRSMLLEDKCKINFKVEKNLTVSEILKKIRDRFLCKKQPPAIHPQISLIEIFPEGYFTCRMWSSVKHVFYHGKEMERVYFRGEEIYNINDISE